MVWKKIIRRDGYKIIPQSGSVRDVSLNTAVLEASCNSHIRAILSDTFGIVNFLEDSGLYYS